MGSLAGSTAGICSLGEHELPLLAQQMHLFIQAKRFGEINRVALSNTYERHLICRLEVLRSTKQIPLFFKWHLARPSACHWLVSENVQAEAMQLLKSNVLEFPDL